MEGSLTCLAQCRPAEPKESRGLPQVRFLEKLFSLKLSDKIKIVMEVQTGTYVSSLRRIPPVLPYKLLYNCHTLSFLFLTHFHLFIMLWPALTGRVNAYTTSLYLMYISG